MNLFIEFIFYLTFFIFKLYYFINKYYLFSMQGQKLDKYIINGKINSNLFQNNFKLKNFIYSQKFEINKIIVISLISITILFAKVALTFNFISSNLCVINVLGKKLDLAILLNNQFIFFKLLYYLLFLFFVSYFLVKVLSIIDNYKKKKVRESTLTQTENEIVLGLDKSNNKEVVIPIKGLYQNVLITGSIGSGKTSGAISTILIELVKKDIGGVILDVKGSYINDVKEILKKQNKLDKLQEISMKSEYVYNPLDKPNISSSELANDLIKVITLTSKNNNSDDFWFDKAEAYIRDFITLIRFYEKTVTFKELNKLVIDVNYLKQIITKVKNKLIKSNYSIEEIFELNSAILNISEEYMKLDSRTISIIKAEITRVTNVFVADYMVSKKFDGCSNEFDIKSGNIYVFSINIAEFKKLSKVIATFIKLDFQRQVLFSNSNLSPIFFICDEYQEFVNFEDSKFFALSREYRCINVISMQSYSSLINSLKDENTAKVIIQNLVNKIWFRNDDMYTVHEIIKQIGKEEKEKTTLNLGETGGDSRYSVLTKSFNSKKTSLSKSYTVSKNQEYILTENYFTQKLKSFEATCLLSNGSDIKVIKKVVIKRK